MNLAFDIAGIGWWSPGVATWSQARALIADDLPWPNDTIRPVPTLIPANERRRAPETVLLALAAGEQAIAEAGLDAADLTCVFASSFGDLGINDYLCATLAATPDQLSPTRFHNSVHNAASGYWGIATGARQPTTSISADPDTFAAALLETAAQIADSGRPALLVAYDIAARGPLVDLVGCREAFAVALVLLPVINDLADSRAGNPSSVLARVTLAVQPVEATDVSGGELRAELSALADANPIAAGALPLLAMLTGTGRGRCSLPAGESIHLHLDVQRR